MKSVFDRRHFIRGLTVGAVAIGMGEAGGIANGSPFVSNQHRASTVSLFKGSSRRSIIVRALEPLAPEIKAGIRDRRVVIKPNLTRVKREEQLASTHVDAIWAICHVLSGFYDGKIFVAEGTGPGTPLDEALTNFDYYSLQNNFNVEFVDLRDDDCFRTHIVDQQVRPLSLRMSKLLCSQSTYLISAAVMKTHALSGVTLGLKNVVMAAPLNRKGEESDRAKVHKTPVPEDPRFFNYNLFQLSQTLVPDLTVIDGFVGMQGEGPLSGDPIESRLAIAGLDWLAADRVGTEVMGFDFSRIGHYRYCADAGMGEADLSRIKVVGDSIRNCKVRYTPPRSLERILM